MDDSLRQEHARRVEWNHRTVRVLGLTLRKDNSQVVSMTLMQGELVIFHDWTSHRGNTTTYAMHDRLCSFLHRYAQHILAFDTVEDNGRMFMPFEP